MVIVCEPRIDSWGCDYAHEREEIRECNDPALVVFVRSMLNQRVNGDDKKPAGKAKKGEQHDYLNKGQPLEGNRQRKNRHADRPEWYQAIFDLAGRKKSCGHAPKADANGKRGLKIAAVRLIQVQDVAAVKDDHKLQQCSKKPEVSIAGDSQV